MVWLLSVCWETWDILELHFQFLSNTSFCDQTERRSVFILYFFVNWLSIVIIPKIIIILWRKDWFGLMVSVHAQLATLLWVCGGTMYHGRSIRQTCLLKLESKVRERRGRGPHISFKDVRTLSSSYTVSPLQSPEEQGLAIIWFLRIWTQVCRLWEQVLCQLSHLIALAGIMLKGKHKPQNLPLKCLCDLPDLRIYWSDWME